MHRIFAFTHAHTHNHCVSRWSTFIGIAQEIYFAVFFIFVLLQIFYIFFALWKVWPRCCHLLVMCCRFPQALHSNEMSRQTEVFILLWLTMSVCAHSVCFSLLRIATVWLCWQGHNMWKLYINSWYIINHWNTVILSVMKILYCWTFYCWILYYWILKGCDN